MPLQNNINSMMFQNGQPVNNEIFVSGPENAKASMFSAGSKVIMFDEQNPIFYRKSVSENGIVNFRYFRFEEFFPEVEAQTQLTEETSALKNEVEGLKKDISEIKEMLKGLM